MIKRLFAVPVLVFCILLAVLYTLSCVWFLLWMITGKTYFESVVCFLTEVSFPFFGIIGSEKNYYPDYKEE